MSTNDSAEIKEKLSNIEVFQSQQKEQMSKLLDLLRGNPLNPNDKGMVGGLEVVKLELKEVKIEVAELQQDKKVTKRTVAILATACTIFLGAIQLIIKLYFK